MNDFAGSDGDLAQVRARMDQLEERVVALEQRVGEPSTPPAPGAAAPGDLIPDEVVRLAKADRKIEAIKALRAHSGLGLADAKRVVDEL